MSFFICSWPQVYALVFPIGFIIIPAMQLRLLHVKQINCVVPSLAVDQYCQSRLIHTTIDVLRASPEELGLLDPTGQRLLTSIT